MRSGTAGYPLGLRAEEIDLNARIFAVADAFDAMISDRVYRAGRPMKRPRRVGRFAGRHLTRPWWRLFTCPREDWDELRRRLS